jgi:hypothetical protein
MTEGVRAAFRLADITDMPELLFGQSLDSGAVRLEAGSAHVPI